MSKNHNILQTIPLKTIIVLILSLTISPAVSKITSQKHPKLFIIDSGARSQTKSESARCPWSIIGNFPKSEMAYKMATENAETSSIASFGPNLKLYFFSYIIYLLVAIWTILSGFFNYLPKMAILDIFVVENRVFWSWLCINGGITINNCLRDFIHHLQRPSWI